MAKNRSTVAEPHRFISIRGAREHNLKNVDVDLPRDRLVVITGLSGSGKSSLAFDTVYAEGQRRYVESLSAYARQFLELMQKPDVDSIEGLSPAISIEQKTTSRNPRSTVGTVTEIYDYLRLLFARVGVPYSPATGLPIESQTVSQMVDRIMTMPEGTRLYLLAPIARGRKGEYRKELQELQKRGFQRVKIDGKMYEIDEAPALDKKYKHDIDVVVDRIVVRPDLGNRLADSIETALTLAEGTRDRRERRHRRAHHLLGELRLSGLGLHASRRSSRGCSRSTPRTAPARPATGSASRCSSIRRWWCRTTGCRSPKARSRRGPIRRASITCRRWRASPSTSRSRCRRRGATCPKKVRDTILLRQRRRVDRDALRRRHPPVPDHQAVRGRDPQPRPPLDARPTASWVREELERFQRESTCETCNGARLKPEALAVKIAGLNISQTTEFSIGDAVKWFLELDAQAHAAAARDRRAHPEGDQRAAGLPQQCRARLPDAQPHLGHAVGRREPAHPARLADRLGPDRRALRAGRAVDRAAPARQRTAAEDAASGCAISATRCSWSSTTRTRSAPPTIWSTWDRAPACMAATSSPRARPRR